MASSLRLALLTAALGQTFGFQAEHLSVAPSAPSAPWGETAAAAERRSSSVPGGVLGSVPHAMSASAARASGAPVGPGPGPLGPLGPLFLGLLLGLCAALCVPLAPARAEDRAPDLESGKGIFLANCAACHAGGNNAVQPDKKLKKDALQTYGMFDVERIKYQVTNGKNAMPAFGERLGAEDIEDVANYVIDQANKGWS